MNVSLRTIKIATATLGVIALAGIGALIAVNVGSGPTHSQNVQIVANDDTPTTVAVPDTSVPVETTTTEAPATTVPVTAPPTTAAPVVTDPPVTEAPRTETTDAPVVQTPTNPDCLYGGEYEFPAPNGGFSSYPQTAAQSASAVPLHSPCIDSTDGYQHG